jgi:hypothetical protein
MTATRTATAAVCDFCSGVPVVTRYACAPFDIPCGPHRSHATAGGWRACRTCRGLVDAGEREALKRRAVASYARTAGHVSRCSIRWAYRELHMRTASAAVETFFRERELSFGEKKFKKAADSSEEEGERGCNLSLGG